MTVVLKRNEELHKQSELFMSYLRRNHQSTEVEEKQEKSKRRQRREKKIVTLNAEQLINVASHENDALQKEIGQTRKEGEKMIDKLKALLEETDMEIAELKKEAYEFNRDIVIGAENFRTGKTQAEKV